MMKLNIQLFGSRGASGSNVIKIKNATFTTAIRTYDENGNRQREDIQVKGVTFKYKTIDIGVFDRTQENYPDETVTRGANKYIAVIRTKNETNGLMITTGKTQKEAVQNSMELIDKRKKDILRAIGRGQK